MLPAETPSGTAALATAESLLPARPKRADARRNYERILAAARAAFAEHGASTSLEEIARRAEVGIGTLYRNFPNRQALLEAVYVDEVEDVCRSAAEFESREPWEALSGWLRRLAAYIVTKQALASELFDYLGHEASLFTACRTELLAAGEPLLQRAQRAHAVRDDVDVRDLIQLVGGIAKTQAADPEQIGRLLEITLDGLRNRSAS